MMIRLTSLIMPVSWFNVDFRNGFLYINTNRYTVTPGNYSIKQLLTVLNTFVQDVQFSFDPITYKVKMVAEVPTSLDGPLLVLLGIQPGTGYVLESKYFCDMSGNQAVNVETDFTSIFPSLDARDFGSPSLLARVGITQPFGSVINYLNPSGKDGMLLSSPVLDNIRLVLTQEDRLPLLSVLDYDATLILEFKRTTSTRLTLS
jgi:hypothetical protein